MGFDGPSYLLYPDLDTLGADPDKSSAFSIFKL